MCIEKLEKLDPRYTIVVSNKDTRDTISSRYPTRDVVFRKLPDVLSILNGKQTLVGLKAFAVVNHKYQVLMLNG